MTTTIKTATINGITFRRIDRSCGGLIVIDGRKGYTWSSIDGHEREADGRPGVYHCTNHVNTLLPGVDVAEYRAAMGV